MLAQDSVAWTLEDEADERVFGVGHATAAGVLSRPLTLPAKRHSGVWGFAGSDRALAIFISPSVDQPSPGVGRIWAGSRGGTLRPFVPEIERLRGTRNCARRVARFGEPGGSQELSVSGERVAYTRKVTCRSSKRRARWQLVLRNLRTGKTRLLRRSPAGDVQFAGDFVAYRREVRNDNRRIYVVRASTGKIVYRASLASVVRQSIDTHYSLGSDGTVAIAYFTGGIERERGRLAWVSPSSPRLHTLGAVALYRSSPLKYANGRIVFVKRYDGNVDELAVTTLRGTTRTLATFTGDEQLDAFDFDGSQIAFAHSKYRPDQGRADDGLPSQCWSDDKTWVQSRAAIVEVHQADSAGRMPAAELPSAAPHRSAVNTRQECPYKD